MITVDGLSAILARSRQVFPEGTVVYGRGVGTIIRSKVDTLPVGTRVLGGFGWQDIFIGKPEEADIVVIYKKPELLLEDYAAIINHIGVIAYFCVRDVSGVKPGEIAVVTNAHGGVGSAAGQLLKRRGATVIGVCGSDEKCTSLIQYYGFDYAINYRTQDVAERVRAFTGGSGVDIIFDTASNAFGLVPLLKARGRFIATGMTDPSKMPEKLLNPLDFFLNHWTFRAPIIVEWVHEFGAALHALEEEVARGRRDGTQGLKYRIDKRQFSDAKRALDDLLNGRNFGKVVLCMGDGIFDF
eukprot:GDKJ01022075.1.p1 GENE.GDKJ01022075.1~~GDKJ01022075.1.p1  ORF type:complete len:344 (-),score=42.90 GDKJ01022075.1:436-1329(-)